MSLIAIPAAHSKLYRPKNPDVILIHIPMRVVRKIHVPAAHVGEFQAGGSAGNPCAGV